MRIGVVADTHVPKRAKKLPSALLEGFEGVDLILHAGDWVSLDVAKELEQLAPVDGIAGNNDGDDIRRRFGESKILQLEGYRIGLVHGDGKKGTTAKRAWDSFRTDHVNVIIFGHSHIPFSQNHHGVLLFNPGSPTDKRRQPRYSFGIIELGNTINARHYYFDKE
jgi:putative phosphoesterase